MRSERLLPRLFLVLLVAVIALAGWQWHDGAPVSANLMELVPGSAQDPLEQRAEQRMQEPLNRELLVLVGSEDRQTAVTMARTLGEQWQASGVFEKVQFNGFTLVPSQDDWLGLTGRIQGSQPRHGAVDMDLTSGALVANADGRNWVLLRARTHGDAFDMQLPLKVADLLADARQQAGQAQVQLLAASGLLYAANGQREATREISWVGGGATAGILLLLLLAFRRWRVLLAFVPVLVGMLFGAVACVALFGKMHVMTLVLGSSLIGVAVDYPLHYLSKSWSLKPWHSWPALRLTLPGLSLSLATSCIGYLALAFTPFPALTQIAAFSAAGLIGAYLCAVCLLPALLKDVDLRPAGWPLELAQHLLNLRERLLRHVPSPALLLILAVFCGGGLWHLQIKNDIRQWVGTPPGLLEQAQAIARITGYQPTSQFFLVQGADEQQLLEREEALGKQLNALVAGGKLHGYMALSQLVSPPKAQIEVRDALSQLPGHWQPLLALGIPEDALRAELTQLGQLPLQTIESALLGPLGEPWRGLWLGPTGQGVASMVSLQGLSDAGQLRTLAQDLQGVKLVDRLGDLNRVFAQTQVSAAELKLASCILIVLLLLKPFGLGGAVRMVALPLLAAFCSLASLGWLGQPLTLFSLFGLLLVTAISVDYAILMRERIGGAAVSLLGTLLAAATTWLSFGLLAVSSTPAVSNFGLSVSLGLAFSFLLAPWAASGREEAPRA